MKSNPDWQKLKKKRIPEKKNQKKETFYKYLENNDTSAFSNPQLTIEIVKNPEIFIK